VRGLTEQGAELADEMKRRHRRLTRHVIDRQRAFVRLTQHVAGAAEAHERVIGEHGPLASRS
jgi:hypothetical protein